MFWTYSPSFLMLHMKIFPRLMDGRDGRHETLLNAQTCSTKSKGKPPGMTVSCCQAQASGSFPVQAHLPSLALFWASKGWFPGSTDIIRLNCVHQSIQGRPHCPGGLYLAWCCILNEALRLLHYKIQPDVVQNAINPFKTTTKTKTKEHHTGSVKHFTWSFSWTGKY